MLYREAGQFKTTYAADQQIFPIRQDRIGILVLLVIAFLGVPMLASEYLVMFLEKYMVICRAWTTSRLRVFA